MAKRELPPKLFNTLPAIPAGKVRFFNIYEIDGVTYFSVPYVSGARAEKASKRYTTPIVSHARVKAK